MRDAGAGGEPAGPAVGPNDTARRALSLLLVSGTTELPVVEDGVATGRVTLDDIRAAARRR
jgi:hypothetical protein